MRAGRVGLVGLVGLAGLLPVAGCADSEGPTGGAEIVDSAGVRIVELAELRGREWTVSSDPLLSLGTVDGEGPENFFRVSAAVRSENGTLTVFNASSSEARQFGPDGEHLRTLGGQGQGPGEFMGVSRMRALPQDRLAVWDTRARRLTVFDAAGGVETTIQPDGIERRPRLIAVRGDGSTFFEQEIPIYEPAPTALRQDYSNYIWWNADGSVRDSLPRQEKVEVIIYGEGPMAGPPRFGTSTVFAGDTTGYWVGGQKEESVVRYSSTGQVEVIVRWRPVDRTVGPAAADVWLENRLLEVTDDDLRERVIDLHNGTPVAERFPAYGDLFVDRVGMLWMKEFERPGREESSRWWVFDPTGMLRGEVRIPLGYRIFDIGVDYIVAGRTDDFGIEFVDVLSLSRSDG